MLPLLSSSSQTINSLLAIKANISGFRIKKHFTVAFYFYAALRVSFTKTTAVALRSKIILSRLERLRPYTDQYESDDAAPRGMPAALTACS